MSRGAALASLVAVLLLTAPAAPAAGEQLNGTVTSAGQGLGGFTVRLLQATPGAQRPRALGTARSRADGSFALRYRGADSNAVHYLVAARPGGAAEAGYAVPASSYRLAATLGDGAVPRRAALTDRSTVATGFALAQFLRGGGFSGKSPGLENAAAMSANLVTPRSGEPAPVLRRFPNGNSTSALATFNSLANLVAGCRRQGNACARLLALSVPGKAAAADTLAAVSAIARNPWQDPAPLFRLSRQVPAPYVPALAGGEQPDAWTLALRFEGAPKTMTGPGNFAIDAEGSLWVVNNYEYSREPKGGPCGGELLLRFAPDGHVYPGSPYEGGGLSGGGFGVAIAPNGRVWVANFGFAARGCEKAPPHNSVSLFTASGLALSPNASPASGGGFTAGELDWPQGIASDRGGNLWIANCGNDSVTRYPGGLPLANSNLGPAGLERPFAIAIGDDGRAFVTGNGNGRVGVYNNDGTLSSVVSGHGLSRPLGVATDSRGYAWIANSGKIVSPCASVGASFGEGGAGTITLLEPDGTPAGPEPLRGAGMTIPWGVAVDGDDTIWVANFSGQRLSQLCGTQPQSCPPGHRRTGASISPNRSGYGFDGLVRNTGVAVDPAGNVWLANNWKNKAIQTNPGGYQIVAYLGLAAPVKTPVIGTPQRP